MNYADELTKAMDFLAKDPKTIFLGQAVEYPGTAMANTFKNVPKNKLIEIPVAEEMQAGFALGLALEGYLPISLYPRMNFIILAMNQIVNHLDKWEAMSCGMSKPKVIMKAVAGSQYPLDPGHQHKANYTEAFKSMVTNIDVVELLYPEQIMPTYQKAIDSDRSILIAEFGDLY